MGKREKTFFEKHKSEFALYRIRQKLLWIITGLLVLFSLLMTFMYYFAERNIYQKNMKADNAVMANQIAAVYELYIQNVKEIAYETAYVNRDLFSLSIDERENVTVKSEIQSMLKTASVMNSYLHSAYLYYKDGGLVYSSYSLPYSLNRIESFGDKGVFDNAEDGRPYLVGPHLLYPTEKLSDVNTLPLVISYVVPVNTENGKVYLCVNTNAKVLYSAIMRNLELEESKNFYLVDDNDSVVFHRNPEYLFIRKEELPQNKGTIVSEAYSDILNATIVFESTMPPMESNIMKALFFILFVLVIGIIIVTAAIWHSTMPIHRMVQIAKKTELRDFLEKSDVELNPVYWDSAMKESKNTAIALFYLFSRSETERFLNQCVRAATENAEDCLSLAVKMSGETVALIFSNVQNYTDEEFLQRIRFKCEDLCEDSGMSSRIYCVVSRVKEGLEELREGYQECSKTLQYRYLFRRPVILSEEIDVTLPEYPFPLRHERHIINNLSAGKKDACIRHIDEIFAELRSGKYLIKDRTVNRYLTIMQENLSLHLNNSAVPMENAGYENYTTLEEEYDRFLFFVNMLFEQNEERKRKTPDIAPGQFILDYIEQHFCDNDICLSKIADACSVTANAVSSAIKEITHRSFSEYITYKRIERSKKLLTEGRMSVNEVAEEVGFTYPYYFIRKFKEAEGVTPGQYVGAEEDKEESES